MSEQNLHQLIESGNLQAIQSMVASGVNLNELGPEGIRPLSKAVELGNLEVVRLLICSGADIDDGGIISPLHMACGEGHLELVKLLLGNQANPDNLDEEGSTPLMWAASLGNIEIVKLLIEAGADPNIQDDMCQTAIICAANNHHEKVVNYLSSLEKTKKSEAFRDSEDPPKKQPSQNLSNSTELDFILAVKKGKIDLVINLLSKNIDINATDLVGYTALCWASSKEHLDIVKLLINSKADVNAGADRTPLGLAAERGNIEIIKELLKAGADANYRDSSGYLPITYAQERGDWRVFDLLQQWQSPKLHE